jgi:hypothetical protein
MVTETFAAVCPSVGDRSLFSISTSQKRDYTVDPHLSAAFLRQITTALLVSTMKERLVCAAVALLALLATHLLSSHLSSYNITHHLSYSSYREYGLPSITRPSIIIIPGLDGITAFFDEIIPELSAAEYHVVVYHLPLYSSAQEYSFESIARTLRDILEELNLFQVVLVGESFGGAVAQYFAFYYPIYIDRLILLSSMAHVTLPAEVAWKANFLLPPLASLGRWIPALAQVVFFSSPRVSLSLSLR